MSSSTITKALQAPKGNEIDDQRAGQWYGSEWAPYNPPEWEVNEWIGFWLLDLSTSITYRILSNTKHKIVVQNGPSTSGPIEAVVVSSSIVVNDYAAKLRLERWESATPRGIAMSQSFACAYSANLTFSCGTSVKAKKATTLCPGIYVDVTIEFKNSVGGIISTVVQTNKNAGCVITYNDDGSIKEVRPEKTIAGASGALPVGLATIKVTWFFYNPYSLVQDRIFVDDFFASTKNINTYVDSYLMIDREVLGFTGFVVNEDCSYFTGITRGLRGTLKAKHKHKTKGNIIKIVGGQDEDSGHPLNCLLRLLMTTDSGTNTYDPTNHKYDKGDGFGLGLAKFGNDLTNTKVDVAGIEAMRDASSAYRCEFRFLQGIGGNTNSGFKEWVEAEIMRPFGYRWVIGVDGKMSVGKLTVLFLDGERAGTFSGGGVFTPTVAPGWWLNQWLKAPALYLWVKETNLTYPITANTTTTITATGAPTSGNFTCAILPSAAIQPSTSAVGYPYVAEFTERDMDGAPEILYTYDVVNKIIWNFDYDPSNTIDNKTTTKHLSLAEYSEESFWGSTFYNGANSSHTRYGDQELSYKTAGLRGCGAAKFANGYNMDGDKVARMVSFELLLRWREQLPALKFTANSLEKMYVDVGDVVRIKHRKCEDLQTGLEVIDKICQVSNIRSDYESKKLVIEAQSLSDIQYPPLIAPITFPTIQNYFIDIRHPSIEVIKNLKIRDYPFYVANLFFIRQVYGATSAEDAKARKWYEDPTTGLVVPTFSGYRHTNFYVCDTVGGTYKKIAESNEPYIYFAWQADDDSKTPLPLFIKFSYSSTNYDPVTGIFQESSLYPAVPIDVSTLELYKKGVMGVDMERKHDSDSQFRMMERATEDRGYSKIGRTME